MEDYQEDELARIKELLRHSSEFIAYFELVEAKMIEWKQDIEQQAIRLESQFNTIKKDLSSIQINLSQANLVQFKKTTEAALSQGEAHLRGIEKTCQQLTIIAQQHQAQISHLTEECLLKIDKHSSDTLHSMNAQFSKYDAHQFHRIASESCDHVDRVASDAVYKSTKILRSFKLKLGLLLVFTTILSAFFYSLYLNDELPWEAHQQVMHERQAGKVLLRAWLN
jgi:hypothetical protein